MADEAKVARSVIFRNSEFMELVSIARGENPVAINQASSDETNRTDELEQENQLLKARVAELEHDNQNLAINIQAAWQNGYQAGCKESLTIYSTPQQTPAESATPMADETESVDTFTAKLYEALKVDGVLEEVSTVGTEELVPNFDMETSFDGVTADQYMERSQYREGFTTDTAGNTIDETTTEQTNEQIDEEIEEDEGEEEDDLDDQDTEDDESPEIDSEFTEGDLRSLVTNRFVRPEEAVIETKEDKTAQTPLHKFVGTHRPNAEPAVPSPRIFPPEIRKACLMLGIRPHELSRQLVLKSWKDEIGKPGVHPDSGGDTEMAIYLNVAKDTLIRWIDTQSPKLGKKFGAAARTENNKSQTDKSED